MSPKRKKRWVTFWGLTLRSSSGLHPRAHKDVHMQRACAHRHPHLILQQQQQAIQLPAEMIYYYHLCSSFPTWTIPFFPLLSLNPVSKPQLSGASPSSLFGSQAGELSFLSSWAFSTSVVVSLLLTLHSWDLHSPQPTLSSTCSSLMYKCTLLAPS